MAATTRKSPTERHAARVEKRRSRLPERLANAHTPSDLIAAAADHLRSALRLAPRKDAEAVAALVVEDLVAHADRLLGPRSKS